MASLKKKLKEAEEDLHDQDEQMDAMKEDVCIYIYIYIYI